MTTFTPEQVQAILDYALNSLILSGFYEELGIARPTAVIKVVKHDVLDHFFNPSGKVIPTNLFGECLAHLNRVARNSYMMKTTYGSVPSFMRVRPVDNLMNFMTNFPTANGEDENYSEVLEEMLVQMGEQFFVDWFNQCERYWQTSEITPDMVKYIMNL